MEQQGQGTYSILLLIEHEGSDGPTLVGMGSSLSTNVDGGTPNAEMVGGSRNGTEGRRHLMRAVMRGDNQSG